MRNKLMFMIGLVVVGILAYYGGYFTYTLNRPKVEIEMPAVLQRGNSMNKIKPTVYETEHYLAVIEQDVLMIYKMPDESVYDSLKTDNLQFQEEDFQKLQTGIVFRSLKEVFEFLESCMS